jgi:hypothetical protein
MKDNFYEVHTKKCTKTLYKTDTILPIVFKKKANTAYKKCVDLKTRLRKSVPVSDCPDPAPDPGLKITK